MGQLSIVSPELQATDQQTAADAAARTSSLALIRYRDGASNYLEVVTAQTDALTAQRALIQVQTLRARAAVALVKALGGVRFSDAQTSRALTHPKGAPARAIGYCVPGTYDLSPELTTGARLPNGGCQNGQLGIELAAA